MGLTLANNAVGYIQAYQAASAQESFGKDVYRLNKSMADQNAFDAYVALADRQIQEHEAAAKSLEEISASARKAQALVRVSAGEAGVSGGSTEALLTDFRRQELTKQAVVTRNLGWLDTQISREREGVRMQQYGQILSGLPQPVQYPSLLGTALQTGSQLLGQFHQFAYNPATGTYKSPF